MLALGALARIRICVLAPMKKSPRLLLQFALSLGRCGGPACASSRKSSGSKFLAISRPLPSSASRKARAVRMAAVGDPVPAVGDPVAAVSDPPAEAPCLGNPAAAVGDPPAEASSLGNPAAAETSDVGDAAAETTETTAVGDPAAETPSLGNPATAETSEVGDAAAETTEMTAVGDAAAEITETTAVGDAVAETVDVRDAAAEIATGITAAAGGGGQWQQFGEWFRVSDSVSLVLHRGDITEWFVDGKTDAIVNAANPRMLGGGGVDGAIHTHAGPELLEACRRVPEVRPRVRCPTGEARITPGFKLPVSKIIHTVGPIFREEDNPAGLLGNAYRNSLNTAIQNGIKYIAFPAISCGIYGYPAAEAANVSLSAIREVSNGLSQVHFVLFENKTFSRWMDEASYQFDRIQGKILTA